jgi:hypothetical protein
MDAAPKRLIVRQDGSHGDNDRKAVLRVFSAEK